MALLQKAGTDIPTPVLALFPLAVGALFLIGYLRSREPGQAGEELRSLDRPVVTAIREPNPPRLAAEVPASGRK